ncbi:hypothetical protein CXF85_09215 [Colwellia sp. 75C3]|uniref:beta-ketoacyl synthase N-terminal-like domain-containing protein n=1 Tax=Colwellia sp. 75C3 TaxID=888425 RepID=UPI000C346999|nr:beta-ketoacyl synthase N-terminal-like domain-containing protein [Colwellia sp. 75C3]PKG84089.1 hypothetical protein CXF85_09215 [Colwellia sp. 75C3]
MSALNQLFIAATGMITPVGFNTAMTHAAVQAGINVYERGSYCNGNVEALTMTQVPDDALPPLAAPLIDVLGLTARQARMLQLAAPAIEQIYQQMAELPNTDISAPMAVFLAGPEPIPNAPLPIRSIFLKHLQCQIEKPIDLDNSKVFPMGRAGAFFALESAFQYLQTSSQPFALVGGVDTFWHATTLSKFMQDKRVKTEAGGADCFVPGEGAGFILLSKQALSPNNRAITRPGLAAEEGHRYSDEPYLGNGLAQAFTEAVGFANIMPENNIKAIYSSLNGELFGGKEFGVAQVRNAKVISPEANHQHPADCYGDLGAATGPVLLALAALNSAKPSICYGSSDDEFRGAACVV